MERAIAFSNDAGQTLHGILHLPEPRTSTTLGVVLLSPGQKVRLGPWRSYVTLARRLCAMGVPVLRFDFHGLGDSEGRHEHGQYLVDFNGFVQTGGLSGDVHSATRFFTREAAVTRFVFAGLCGGAATGLLAAPAIQGIYGHVLVDLPVTISNSARQRWLEQNAAEMLKLRPEESRGVFRDYLAKATDLGAWRRLISGGSDYKLLIESARRVGLDTVQRVAERLPGPLAAKLRAPAPAPAATAAVPTAAAGAEEVANQPTIDAFLAAREAGQKMFFLNSSNYHPMFDAYFGSRFLPADRATWKGLGLVVVPDTNHVFSAEHSQRALFETVEEFVRNAVADVAGRPARANAAPDPSTQVAR